MSNPERIGRTLANYIIGLRHVGHVVPDLEAAIQHFQHLYGLTESSIQRLPDQGADTQARFAFVTVGDTQFELIEPVADAQKVVLHSAPSGGAGINHVAWTVRDLDGAVSLLSDQGIQPGYVTPAGPVQMPGKRMVYLDPATTGGLLVELVEPDEGN